MSLTADAVDRFEAARPRLEAIAYRLLGSAGEAEDAVQETFLRWQAADVERIEVPEAWLTKVLTNLCLNHLTSARARRETYVGEWLPEPLLAGDPMLGPADTAEQRESVSYAVLTLMERLSPAERAVYVLREAFDYPHREIADILDISESASQQTYHRAKRRVAEGKARAHIDESAARRIVEEFLAAAASGRIEAVARLVRGLVAPGEAKRAMVGGAAEVHAWVVNGEPAAVAVVDGRVVAIMCLEVTPEGISAVRNQVNPDKLVRATEQWAATDHGEPLMTLYA
jgi:RNA polymerase sigma factor (sigma-70 family)